MIPAFARHRISSSDPYWSDVVSLLHFDGTSGSTTMTDQTGLSWTSNNGAALSNSQSKFGGTSLYLNASNHEYLYTGYSSSIDLLNGGVSWTIEAWVYANTSNSNGARIFCTSGGASGFGGTNQIHILFQSAGASLSVQISQGTSTPVGVAASGSFATGQWNHVAACFDGSHLYIALNGTVNSVSATTASRPSGNPVAEIGFINGDSDPQYYWNGYIDDFRITKGVARYTANFTPPTAAFPNH